MLCNQCGAEFIQCKPNQLYCSPQCRQQIKQKRSSEKRSQKRNAQWSNIDKKRSCVVCNQEFELQVRHRTQRYCSDVCRKKAERLFGNKRQTDLNYKNQIRYGGNQFKVMERDNYTCQLCTNTSQLVVHHKDFTGQSDNPNNSMDNLITLCRSCHIKVHRLNEL